MGVRPGYTKWGTDVPQGFQPVVYDFTKGRLPQGVTHARNLGAMQILSDGTYGWASENLILNSDLVTSWSKTGCVVSIPTGVKSPLGGDAYLITSLAGNTQHYARSLGQVSIPVGQTVRVYVHVKRMASRYVYIGSASDAPWHIAMFDFDTGLWVSGRTSGATALDPVPLPDGWWRLGIEYAVVGPGHRSLDVMVTPLDSTESTTPTYDATGNESVIAWGGDLMRAPNADTSHVTTTSAVFYGPVFTWDKTTLQNLGIRIEQASTNYIRNNTCVGLVAGTPGTAPTSHSWSTTANGVTRQIIGMGIEGGILYYRIRWYATNPTASVQYTLSWDYTAAVSGQAWSAQFFIAGEEGNVYPSSGIFGYLSARNSVGSQVSSQNWAYTPTTASLDTQRILVQHTTTQATTAIVDIDWRFNAVIGQAFDFTLKVGICQLEQSAEPTSLIHTAGNAVTRPMDNVQGFGPLGNQAWTVIVNGRASLSTGAYRALLVLLADSNNGILFYRDINTGQGRLYPKTDGVTSPSGSIGVIANATDFGVAMRFPATGQFAASINGATTVASVNSVRTPLPFTTMLIGASTGFDSSSPWQGTIKSIEFRHTIEDDISLKELSSV